MSCFPAPLRSLLPLTLGASLLGGCGVAALDEGDVHADYGEAKKTLIAVQRNDDFYRVRGSTPNDGAQCVLLDGTCVATTTSGEWCEPAGGPADLLVVDGEVVKSVCYPPAEDGTVITLGEDGVSASDLDVLQTESGTAFTFHEDTDGEPFVGDVIIDGNQVSVYGNGPDRTVIDGDLILRGNGARVRGVQVTGDVIVDRNRASLILSEVGGDVRFVEQSTNGAVVAATVVFGSITAEGNNLTLIDNDVQQGVEANGTTDWCVSNHGFDDEDEDGVVDDGEYEDELDC